MKKTLLLLLLASTGAFAAETQLKLPRDANEIRDYMTPTDSRCPGCGIVSNVRQVQQKGAPRNQQATEPATGGNPDLGGESGTATIAGTGAASKAARKEARKPAAPAWLVTVRYDDGSYAAFEQDDRPSVRKGDRIQVNAGKVERYVAH